MIEINGIGLILCISVVSKLPLIPIPEHGYENEEDIVGKDLQHVRLGSRFRRVFESLSNA